MRLAEYAGELRKLGYSAYIEAVGYEYRVCVEHRAEPVIRKKLCVEEPTDEKAITAIDILVKEIENELAEKRNEEKKMRK